MINKLLTDKCPSYSSILAGIAKGKIVLDCNNNPRLALVYSYCVGGYCLLGTDVTDEHLKSFLEDKAFLEVKKTGVENFEFSTESKHIEKSIMRIFADKEINKELEYTFRKSTKITDSYYLPEEYRIVEVDKDLVSKEYENLDMILDRIVYSWHSFDDFYANSLAYIAVIDNEIVGVCFGSASYNNYLAVDIEVAKEHRKKNLATNLVKEFVNKSILLSKIAHWDCVESNVPSIKLAEKCDFSLIRQKPYYWFKL